MGGCIGTTSVPPQAAATADVRAYIVESASAPLKASTIKRRLPLASDVEIEILYCGVCHSDLHQVRNEWGNSIYPMVPGHEIVGKVSKVGSRVSKFKVGDVAGVGCMVWSCQRCGCCKEGVEQYCTGQVVPTYNGTDPRFNEQTFGGYAKSIVVDEKFVVKVPTTINLAAAAPLLCAGITTYSPLKFWKIGPKSRVGILGFGGLGHMGVKFAKALGAFVVVLTTSPGKVDDAKRLGADEVIVSTAPEQMKAFGNSLDFILDTAAANHDLVPFLNLLRLDGTLCQVGAPEKPAKVSSWSLLTQRRTIAGSAIGSIKETQEMLDFCGQHNIVCDIETITMKDINTAYERLAKNDVKYRFVIDIATL